MTDSPKGDVILLFALSAESKKDKNLCVLSVSAVTSYFYTIFDPFRVMLARPAYNNNRQKPFSNVNLNWVKPAMARHHGAVSLGGPEWPTEQRGFGNMLKPLIYLNSLKTGCVNNIKDRY